MQVRADQLAAHLAEGPAPAVHAVGRRAAAGAGGRRRDPRRGARGRLHRAAGAHRHRRALRLERAARRVAGDEPVRRQAADRDPHPVGQARQGRLRGAAALLRDAVRRRRHAGPAAAARPPAAGERLVRRARRAPASTVRVDPVERKALPQWIAQRLARAGPARAGRRGRPAARWPSSPTASKATCSPRTRRSRSSALLYPAGELSFEQIEAAVLNVARYDVFKLGEAVLAGQVGARAAHARRPAGRGRGGRCWCTGRWPRTSAR